MNMPSSYRNCLTGTSIWTNYKIHPHRKLISSSAVRILCRAGLRNLLERVASGRPSSLLVIALKGGSKDRLSTLTAFRFFFLPKSESPLPWAPSVRFRHFPEATDRLWPYRRIPIPSLPKFFFSRVGGFGCQKGLAGPVVVSPFSREEGSFRLSSGSLAEGGSAGCASLLSFTAV